MSPILAGTLTFLCTMGGAILGMMLARSLPAHHLDSESKDVVRISMATVATLSALVVGLLIASAKGSFDERATELRHAAAQSLLLDRMLANYGEEAKPIRAQLRTIIEKRAAQLAQARDRGVVSVALDDGPQIGAVQEAVLPLVPKDDNQRWLKSKALDIAADIAETRWLLVEETQSSIQWPFLIILMFWLGSMFLSFGLFAPRNAMVTMAFLISGLSVGSSIFVILEMDQPFSGFIRISDTPIRQVISELGRP